MRRTVAIAVVAMTMVVAVVVVAVLLAISATAKTTAWVATRDCPAGTTLDGASVHQVQVPTGTDSFKVMSTSPSGKELSHAISAGDVIRVDDFVTSVMVQVPVSFKLAPGLATNDVIDIYASGGASADSTVNAAQGTRLIARHVLVVSVGSPSVIEVPASQEALWVTLASSGVALTATRSSGINVPTAAHAYNTAEVLDMLAQLASSGDGVARGTPPSPTPASPSPSPPG